MISRNNLLIERTEASPFYEEQARSLGTAWMNQRVESTCTRCFRDRELYLRVT